MSIRSVLAVCAMAIPLGLTVAQAQTTSTGGSSGSSPSMEEPVQNPASQPTLTNASVATGTNSISAPFKIQAPSIGNFKMKAGIKSQNTSGHIYDYDSTAPTARRAKLKYEYYLGFVHASGWGTYAQAVTSGAIKQDSNATDVAHGDPSITILHPDWYRGTSLTLSGQLRRYFPVSQFSDDRGIKQWAYYLYTTYQLPRQWSIWNQTVPRYFEQSKRLAASDTTMYIEDLGTLTKSLSTHWAAGVGQWTQVEGHRATDTGISVDVSGFVRYMPIANLWIEPRIILPAYIKNAVYDQSSSVSLSAAKTELYAQMTL